VDRRETRLLAGVTSSAAAPPPPGRLNKDILEQTTNRGNTLLSKALFSHADAVTQAFFGEAVYYRGIVEFSNVCANDCGYCGIAKHQGGVARYTMPIDEVVQVRVGVGLGRGGGPGERSVGRA
jgi:hypothetical protein